MKKLITITLFVAGLALSNMATAQDQENAQQQDQMVKSMQYMLKRAELVRMLAAQHLVYIDENRAEAELHLLDDAAQVMAFSLVCPDPDLDASMLNKIAAESTLQIALKVEESPIKRTMSDALGDLGGKDRLTLIADVSSNVLMFKVGRRRGLFDALLTDFGTSRFCKGMRSNMLARYQGLATYLNDLDARQGTNEPN